MLMQIKGDFGYYSQDVSACDEIDLDNIRIIRPGFGLPPSEFEKVLGRRVKRRLPRGTPLRWEDIG